MDVKEVVREIMTDVRWLENFQIMLRFLQFV